MQRLTITIDDDLVAEVDDFIESAAMPIAPRRFAICCAPASSTPAAMPRRTGIASRP